MARPRITPADAVAQHPRPMGSGCLASPSDTYGPALRTVLTLKPLLGSSRCTNRNKER